MDDIYKELWVSWLTVPKSLFVSDHQSQSLGSGRQGQKAFPLSNGHYQTAVHKYNDKTFFRFIKSFFGAHINDRV